MAIKHPIALSEQVYCVPANAEPGDELGEVNYLYTFCKFWNEYEGTNLNEGQFLFLKVGGPDNFMVNTTTGMITVDNLVGLSSDTSITVRVSIGGMHIDVNCIIYYVPINKAVFFDSGYNYANGSPNGTRQRPFLKFDGSGLGTGTPGTTYFYRRGSVTQDQSAVFVNPKVNGEYPDWIKVFAWGQGPRPVFTDTGSDNRTFIIGNQPWGNNPQDPSLACHNFMMYDIETYKSVADQWYPILVKPVGDNIRIGRYKGSNTLFEHGIVYLPAMLHPYQGAEDRNIFMESIELYNAIDRAIKVESPGVKCYNFRCKNDNSLGATGSPAPTCASKPNVEFMYIDVEVENINPDNLGFQARGSNVVHRWVWAKGLARVMTLFVHNATDGIGGVYLIDDTVIFDRFIIEDCKQVLYCGRHSGTTDIANGSKITNILVKSCEIGVRIAEGAKNILVAYSNLSGCSTSAGYRVYAAAGDGHKLHNCTLFDNTNQDIDLQRSGVEIVNCNYGVIAGAANAIITTSSTSRNAEDLIGAGTPLGYTYDLKGNPVADPPSIGNLEYAVVPDPDLYNFVVTSSDGGIATGSGSFEAGMEVTATAYPNFGYHIKHWELTLSPGTTGIVGQGFLQYSLTMPENEVSIKAIFEPDGSEPPETFLYNGRFLFHLFDSDFQTNVLDVAQTNGFAIPKSAKLIELDQLMKDMKNIGFYQLQDTLANFAVGDPAYSAFSMIDWKKTGNVYSPYGGVIYEPGGVKGDGINAFIDTNFNPATMGVNYTLNDASQGAVVYESPSNDNQSNIISGVTSGGTINTMYNLHNTGQRVNSGNNPVDSLVDLSGIGLKCLNRDNSTTMRLYSEATEFNRNSNSVSIENENQVILRRGDFYGNVGLSVYFMGASIPGEIVQNFRTIYNQFLSRLNLNPIA